MRLILTGFAAALLATPAAAQDTASYPVKPVTLVVPFAAGGPTDTLARVLAQKLTDYMGRPFVIDNRPGAGGNTGSAHVARAAPNGYTLVLGTVSTHGINPSLYRNMPYDHRKDFAPVSQISIVPNVLMVHPSLPVKTVPGLITFLKQNPGKVFYASPGHGTSIHLASELLKMMTKTDMTHVPYKGSAPAMQDVITGQVQLMFDNTVTAWPQVKAGKVRALGVTTRERLKAAPDVPAIAEFLPGFQASAWHGVLAPAKTPPEIVNRLAQEVQKAMKDPGVVEYLSKLDVTAVAGTPAQFAAFINEETERWAAVVNKLGLKVD